MTLQHIKEGIYLSPFPEDYQLLNFTLYEGAGDPHYHTEKFLQESGLPKMAHHLLIQLFPLSLIVKAFDWYLTLSSYQVSSWLMLIDHFHRCQRVYKHNP